VESNYARGLFHQCQEGRLHQVILHRIGRKKMNPNPERGLDDWGLDGTQDSAATGPLQHSI
jgi:hypothetical protein